jgi:aspartate racemase
MKTIGLIGGMSWESTIPYYRIINQTVQARLGGLHSAKLVLYSVEFHDIERLQSQGAWPEAGKAMAQAGLAMQAAGADFLVLCTNTMHKVAEDLEQAVAIPLLHIVDPTAEAIVRLGLEQVGLLGTRFTMEEDFYRGRLQDRYGLKVLVPSLAERETLHRIIFDELCQGKVLPPSRSRVREVIQHLADAGAQGIILGCTELSLLVDPGEAPVPLFDTTRLHALCAAEQALAPVRP